LKESILIAASGVNTMVKAGLEILNLQGKKVKELLESQKLPVPPGFE